MSMHPWLFCSSVNQWQHACTCKVLGHQSMSGNAIEIPLVRMFRRYSENFAWKGQSKYHTHHVEWWGFCFGCELLAASSSPVRSISATVAYHPTPSDRNLREEDARHERQCIARRPGHEIAP